MKTKLHPAWPELRTTVLPTLEAYHRDLLVHDRRQLRNHELPFLHGSRPFGTYIIVLRRPEDYPPEGKKVPYIFGEADRRHLLHEGVVKFTKGLASGSTGTKHTMRYWDGKRLRLVSEAEAVAIALRYAGEVEAAWEAESKRRSAGLGTLAA